VKKIILYFLLFHVTSIFAQVFSPLSLDADVIPECLHEDQNGLLWIGTNHGLYSYDGLQFRAYPSTQLTENQTITSTFEDSQNRIWIGYEHGKIGHLNAKREFLAFMPEEGLPKVKITGFAEKNGDLWFSTYGEGVYFYDKKHLYNFDQADGLPSNEVYTMAFLDKIWVGTDGGLSSVEMQNSEKKINTLGSKEGFADQIITKIVVFQDKILHLNDLEFQHTFEYEPLKDRTSQLQASNRLPLQKIGTKNISDLAFRQNNVWVISEKRVWVCHFPTSSLVDSLPFRVQVHQVEQASGKMIGHYYGTEKGLFYQYYDGKIKQIALKGNENINISVLSQDENFCYVGTFGHGVFIVDKKQQRVVKHFSKKDGLSDNAVLSACGNIFSTVGGLYEINNKDFSIKNVGEKANYSVKYIYSIYADNKKNIWLGTDGDGIICIKPDYTTRKFDTINHQPMKIIYQVLENKYMDELIFVTPQIGIVRYHRSNDTFSVVDKTNGLGSNNIEVIRQQKDNFLIVHDKGFDLMDKKYQTFLPIYHPLLKNPDGKNLGFIDAYEDYFLAQNSIFYSQDIAAHVPKIHFHSIKLFDQVIDYEQDSIFSHEQNFFNFELTGIYYAKPEALRFRYILDGFDNNWIDTKDNNVIFPRLPPGNYTFRAKTMLGNFSSAEIRYHFIVQRPFWQRSWFIASFVIALFSIVYTLIKTRDKHLQRKAALEKEKIIAQYEAIRSQVNPHFLFNTFSTLIAVIENDKAKGVAMVEKISDFFRNMLAYRDQPTITIREELSLLDNYNFILQQRFGENIIIETDITHSEKNIVPLTLQLLIENAVKHNIVSKSKPLKIKIVEEDNKIVVSNNFQPKTNTEPSTKFGLEGITKRYLLLTEKTITIQQTADFFTVKIPIID
jgi:Histidine kinase/Y_Y_Y domain/Two component regulator propeller